jgi:energy-converting hydrogenase B subunit D
VLIIQVAIMLMVAAAGTAVVLTRDPASQTVGLSFYGILLALMFFVYQAPDVALSQIVIGAVALPLMIMLTLAKIRLNEDLAQKTKQKEQQGRKEKAA